MGRSHLVIPDTQVRPGVDLDHFYALQRLIIARRPDVIIHLGDHYDMQSLCAYDRGQMKSFSYSYEEDIEAGNEALSIINDGVISLPDYHPEMHFLLGNHEQRIERHVESNHILRDSIGYDDFEAVHDLWEMHNFLELVEIDGVYYTHFLANPFTGRPIGGTIHNRLKNAGFSFTMGHVQDFQHYSMHLNNKEVINGLICGAFYSHYEDYKGPQGNNHFRGVIYKTNVEDGDYDLESIRLETLIKNAKEGVYDV